MEPKIETILHATAVAVHGKALLIRGASGSGKSGLALEMMARGADLVADDRVILTKRDDGIWLSAPEPLKNMIEARGLGILNAQTVEHATLTAVLDLDEDTPSRLPRNRETILLENTFPLLTFFPSPYFAAGLVQYLKGGRKDTG